jgi:hypothetical protein
MFEVPANVIGGLATTSNAPISPISLFPWLEKLFVGMTTGGTANLAGTFATNNPSLWDFRPGDDAYDSPGLLYVDPFTGRHKTTSNDAFLCNITHNPVLDPSVTPAIVAPTATCPVVPFGFRGGASTDPNDGSLWLYGPFARKRFSQVGTGPGAWGTSVANYALDFPTADAYNNDNSYFVDVQPPTAAVNPSPFFTWIQLAKNVGIGVASQVGPCIVNNGNAPILQPPVSGGTPNPSPSTLGCPYFLPTALVTRAEMSYWVVKAQMDEAQISNFLCATGGDPSGIGPCSGAGAVSTFADVGPAGSGITNPFVVQATPALGIAGVTQAQLLRYIEVMGRRGYSKGCSQTFDLQTNFCPNANVTRAQMAAFIIRAKMSNVFPTTLSGALSNIIGAPYGDAFGVFPTAGQYFTDEPPSDPFYPYIQKMRELRITNGTGTSAYSPNNTLTRQEIATFVMRAFFL